MVCFLPVLVFQKEHIVPQKEDEDDKPNKLKRKRKVGVVTPAAA